MTDLVQSFGFDTASSTDVFLFISLFTCVVVLLFWVLGNFQGSHSSMDAYYGFGYAIPAILAFVISDATSQVAGVLLLMAVLHGCRLGYHLASRWRRYIPVYGGDPRYLRFVSDFSPGYWWKSLFRVVGPQAPLIVLVGSPAVVGILLTRDANDALSWLAFVGFAVFMVGMWFETLGDGQLQSFLADKPHNEGRYIQTGVWKHTRHPNYFGTTTTWWGIWIVAMSADTAVWWTVAGPIMNTVMLSSVLGSKFQDDYMGRRPAYQDLMTRTRKFLPLPVSEAKIAENRARLEDLRAREGAEAPRASAHDGGSKGSMAAAN